MGRSESEGRAGELVCSESLEAVPRNVGSFDRVGLRRACEVAGGCMNSKRRSEGSYYVEGCVFGPGATEAAVRGTGAHSQWEERRRMKSITLIIEFAVIYCNRSFIFINQKNHALHFRLISYDHHTSQEDKEEGITSLHLRTGCP